MSYQPLPADDPEAASKQPLHLGDEAHPRHSGSGEQKRFDRVLKVLTLLLLAMLCALAGLNAVLLSKQTPAEPSIRREYGSSSKYMSLDRKYDYLWDSEADARNALIYLAPPHSHAERPEVGSVSMFHQLHCLTSFRAAMQRAREGEDIGVDWRDDVHWPHCLHYLRQSILCFADATIERGPIVNGTRSRGIDGAHDVRSCGDSERLYELRMQSGVAAPGSPALV